MLSNRVFFFLEEVLYIFKLVSVFDFFHVIFLCCKSAPISRFSKYLSLNKNNTNQRFLRFFPPKGLKQVDIGFIQVNSGGYGLIWNVSG